MSKIITKKMIKDYDELGVVYIPNLFKNHVSNLKKGIEFNLNNPGPYQQKIYVRKKMVAFLMTTVTGKESQNLEKLYLTAKSLPLPLN